MVRGRGWQGESVVRGEGFEPSLADPKSAVLPLDDPRMGPENEPDSGSQHGESYRESQGAYWLTMSSCMPPSAVRSSVCSRAPTLFLSSALLRSFTSAANSASEIFIPACDSFMVFPVYLQGPPDASQI